MTHTIDDQKFEPYAVVGKTGRVYKIVAGLGPGELGEYRRLKTANSDQPQVTSDNMRNITDPVEAHRILGEIIENSKIEQVREWVKVQEKLSVFIYATRLSDLLDTLDGKDKA